MLRRGLLGTRIHRPLRALTPRTLASRLHSAAPCSTPAKSASPSSSASGSSPTPPTESSPISGKHPFEVGAGARGAFHDPAAGPNSRPAEMDQGGGKEGKDGVVGEKGEAEKGWKGEGKGKERGVKKETEKGKREVEPEDNSERDPVREGVRDPVRGPSSSPFHDKEKKEKVEPREHRDSGDEPPAKEADTAEPPPEGEDILNLPEMPTTISPRHQHPFDTYAFVSRLERAGMSPHAARSLMEGVRSLIVVRSERARGRMLSVEELDNASYRFKAALSEIRTEQTSRARKDGIAMRSAVSAMRREVDGLEQQMKVDLQTLRHDIDLDLNNRKTDTRSDMKRFDIGKEEINNKFTISLGDLRTEIESAKWDATRRAISIIAMLVIGGIALSTLSLAPATPTPVAAAPTPPATRDIGIGTDPEDIDEEHLHDHSELVEKRLEALLQDRLREREERERERFRDRQMAREGPREVDKDAVTVPQADYAERI